MPDPNHNFSISAFQSYWDSELSSRLQHGHDGPGAAFYAITNHPALPAVIYNSGFGYASVANEIPFTPSTPCEVRSVTKVLTQALVLKAIEESSITKDSEIGDFSVIVENIDRWANRFVPAASRDVNNFTGGTQSLYALTNCRPPVHLQATLKEIAAHTCGIYPIGKYVDTIQEEWIYLTRWVESDITDNLRAVNLAKESFDSVDDIIAMFGAINAGWHIPQAWDSSQIPPLLYYDLAATISAAICEEVLGDSWYNLIQDQLDTILGISPDHSSSPSVRGNVLHFPIGQSEWGVYFKGHNANPAEVAGLAVPYRLGPITSRNPKGLYFEPEVSMELQYGIGGAAMSAIDLARWAQELRWGNSGYLSSSSIAEMFSVQTHYADQNPANSYWPNINRGFGPDKLKKLPNYLDSLVYDAWGSQGRGGFGGTGGAVVWVESQWWGTPVYTVFAGVTNHPNLHTEPASPTLNAHEVVYQMAADFTANWG